MQVQSVSHNLIKYTHGYLIAASKNQKEPFSDIQNQNPRVRLMPPSVGRNARGGFNFGCIKRVIFDFLTPPYFLTQNHISMFPGPVVPFYMLSLLCLALSSFIYPVEIKYRQLYSPFLLKICLGNQIFIQELFF